MATRLYITNSAPSYTPSTVRTTSVSSSANMVNVALSPTKTGANAAVSQAETSAVNNYRSVLIRGVTEPIYASGTSGGTLQVMIARLESAAAMNANSLLTVYATVGSSDTVRGTLYSTTVDTIEWPTTQTGVTYTVNLGAVALTAGDRIVVEYGYNAANTVTTSYTGTLRYGGTAAADLAAGTTGVTTRSPWIEFSAMDSMLTAPKPKTETLVDDFEVNNLATKWPQAYGTTSVSGGIVSISAAGASAYSGLQTNANTYDLTESYSKIKMTPGAGPYSALTITPSPANGTDVSLYWAAGTLTLGIRTAYSHSSSSSIAVPAGTPIWMGVGEGVAGAANFGSSGAAGNLYFFTSTNGITWTQRHTVASPAYINSTFILVEVGEGTGTSTFDDYNVNTTESYSSTPALSGSGTLTASSAAVMANTGSITGSGTLSSTRVANLKGTVSLAGSGTLKGRLTPADITLSTYKEMALEITSTAENSTKDWTTAYRYIEDISDGRGYTAGIVGWTSGPGDMLVLVQYYSSIAPGNILEQYIPELQQITAAPENQWTSLSHSLLDPTFTVDWMSAADNDPLFRKAQRDERDRMYWSPALIEAQTDNVSPLGLAIYYDISVNHGQGNDPESFQGILAQARNEAVPPSLGGDEGVWLTKVTDLRAAVLTTWGDNPPNGRVAAHRTLIASNNFNLVPSYGWSMYGTAFTMPDYPATPGESVAYTGSGSFTGSGTLTATGKPSYIRSVNLSGSGTLTSTGVVPTEMSITPTVGTSNFTNATTTSITVPEGVALGDVLIIALALNNQQSITARPSQLTLVGSNPFTGTTQGTSEMYYGIVDQSTLSAGTVLTWTLSVTRNCVITLQAYSGVDNTNPIHKIANTFITSSNSTHIAPTVTTTITSHIVESFYGKAAISSPSLSSITIPTNFSGTQEKFATGSYNIGISSANISTDVPPGTYGGDSWSANVATNPESLWTIALKPAQTTVSYSTSAALTGIGSVSSVSKPGIAVSVDRSGSGSLSAIQGVISFAKTVSLSGSGLQTSTSNLNTIQTKSLSGSGTLSASGIVQAKATISLTGSGTLANNSNSEFKNTTNFTGSGTLNVIATVQTKETVSFNGLGTLTNSAKSEFVNTSSITGSGTLSANINKISQSDFVDLSGSGFLGSQTTSSGTGTFSNIGIGELNVDADTVSIVKNINLNSSGILSAETLTSFESNVDFTGNSNLNIETKSAQKGNSTLTGFGVLSTNNNINFSEEVLLSDTGSLSAESNFITQENVVELLGTGFLGSQTAGAGSALFIGTGSGHLSVEVSIAIVQTADFNASGNFESIGDNLNQIDVVNLSGNGTLSTNTIIDIAEQTNFTGIGTLSAIAYAESQGNTTVGLSGLGTLSADITNVNIVENVNLLSSGTLSSQVVLPQTLNVNLAGSGTLSVTTTIDRPEQIELATVVMNSRQYNGSIINNSYQGTIIHRMYSATTNTSPVFIIKFNPPKRLDR